MDREYKQCVKNIDFLNLWVLMIISANNIHVKIYHKLFNYNGAINFLTNA